MKSEKTLRTQRETKNCFSSLRGTKQSIPNHLKFILNCFVPRNDRIDCFVPRNDRIDCFVPRNDRIDCFVPRNDGLFFCHSLMWWFIFVIIVLPIACKQPPPPSNNQVPFKIDTTLKIINANNEIIEFDVELATDDYKKERGLMYRYNLEENQGMFFVFDFMEIRSFWMKNTYISLDMIFIDESFFIVDIHENAFPLSEASILSKVPAKYVFEVKGGLCRKMNIRVGDKIMIDIKDIK